MLQEVVQFNLLDMSVNCCGLCCMCVCCLEVHLCMVSRLDSTKGIQQKWLPGTPGPWLRGTTGPQKPGSLLPGTLGLTVPQIKHVFGFFFSRFFSLFCIWMTTWDSFINIFIVKDQVLCQKGTVLAIFLFIYLFIFIFLVNFC